MTTEEADAQWADPAYRVDSRTRLCCGGIGAHKQECAPSMAQVLAHALDGIARVGAHGRESIARLTAELVAADRVIAELRAELSQLDAVGELQTHNQELFAENQVLRAELARLKRSAS